MAEDASHLRREPIKTSVGQAAALRRRQQAATVGKERRESLVRAKRLCRSSVTGDDEDVLVPENDMMVDEEKSVLDAQTSAAVGELMAAVSFQGKGSMLKRVSALRNLRRLLSRTEYPPVEVAVKAGAISLLVQCLAFGSPDEQLLEASWCLTNIAAGNVEETKALLPAFPMLIAHVGEKSSLPVAEQCAWALGNVAGEGEELRHTLLSQGALLPLARMMLPDKGSTVRTAAWALSNLIKGPGDRAATELIKIDGVLDGIMRHLKKSNFHLKVLGAIKSMVGSMERLQALNLILIADQLEDVPMVWQLLDLAKDEELATEVAWVVVYLSALSNVATNLLLKSDAINLLVERLASSNNLQFLIPVLRSLGNLVAVDSHSRLIPGNEITAGVVNVLVKCLKSEHRVLKKEAAWALSNIAAGPVEHKKMIISSEALPCLLRLLGSAPFDIRKEVAYVLGNLCVGPTGDDGRPCLIQEHLVSLAWSGCLSGFIDLVRSADVEAARLGLQFIELVLRGMPNGEGPKLVEQEDGIDAMERFQFHENDDLRNMANGLVDKYFGEDYGLDE